MDTQKIVEKLDQTANSGRNEKIINLLTISKGHTIEKHKAAIENARHVFGEDMATIYQENLDEIVACIDDAIELFELNNV